MCSDVGCLGACEKDVKGTNVLVWRIQTPGVNIVLHFPSFWTVTSTFPRQLLAKDIEMRRAWVSWSHKTDRPCRNVFIPAWQISIQSRHTEGLDCQRSATLTGTQYDTSGLSDKGKNKSRYGSTKWRCNMKTFQIMLALALIPKRKRVSKITPATSN